jgi:hypothetical protein
MVCFYFLLALIAATAAETALSSGRATPSQRRENKK